MNLRRATEADQPALRELWEEFEAEIPAPPEFVETWDEEWQDVARRHRRTRRRLPRRGRRGCGRGAAGDDARPAHVWHIVFAHVRPRARRRGLLKQLMAPALDEGAQPRLDARHARRDGGQPRGAWRPGSGSASSPRSCTWRRRSRSRRRAAGRRAAPAVARCASTCRPTTTTGSSRRSRSTCRGSAARTHTAVAQPRNGWTRVDDELCSRDPKALRRLGREVSLALGAIVLTLGVEESAVVRYVLWDRGGVADEYASVPEYFGELPPGDVVALGGQPDASRSA